MEIEWFYNDITTAVLAEDGFDCSNCPLSRKTNAGWYCAKLQRIVNQNDCICFSQAKVAPKPKPQTNADRIRTMSDEELAEYLFKRGNCQEYCYGICDIQDKCYDWPSEKYCIKHIIKWLKKEVEE